MSPLALWRAKYLLWLFFQWPLASISHIHIFIQVVNWLLQSCVVSYVKASFLILSGISFLSFSDNGHYLCTSVWATSFSLWTSFFGVAQGYHGFLPSSVLKVVSVFHLYDDFVIPCFCPHSFYLGELALHCLGVRAIYIMMNHATPNGQSLESMLSKPYFQNHHITHTMQYLRLTCSYRDIKSEGKKSVQNNHKEISKPHPRKSTASIGGLINFL